VRLYSTGKEYCNTKVCDGNVTSLVDEVRGEQTGMELVKRLVQRGERKTRIDGENE